MQLNHADIKGRLAALQERTEDHIADLLDVHPNPVIQKLRKWVLAIEGAIIARETARLMKAITNMEQSR